MCYLMVRSKAAGLIAHFKKKVCSSWSIPINDHAWDWREMFNNHDKSPWTINKSPCNIMKPP